MLERRRCHERWKGRGPKGTKRRANGDSKEKEERSSTKRGLPSLKLEDEAPINAAGNAGVLTNVL